MLTNAETLTRLRACLFLLTVVLFTPAVFASASWAGPLDGEPVNFKVFRNAPMEATYSEICCGALSGRFEQASVTRFQTGQGSRVYWLRIDRLPGPGILDFGLNIDRVELFRSGRNPDVPVALAGDQVAAINRSLRSNHQAFLITGEDAAQPVWLRIHHDNVLALEPRFFTKSAFDTREMSSMQIHLIAMGGAVIMVLFNLALGTLVRKALYFVYCVMILCFLVNNLYYSGIGPAQVWSGSTNLSNMIREFAIIVSVICTSLFVYLFLRADGPPSRLNTALLVPAAVMIPASVLLWLLPMWITHIILATLAGLSVVYILAITTILAWRGETKAQVLLPTLLLVTAPSALALIVPKNLPITWETGMQAIPVIIPLDHLFNVVLFADALLFSLLLSYRIRLSDGEAVRAAKELERFQKSTNRRMLETVDRERKRLAADLHDTAGQGLMAITNRLDNIRLRPKPIAAIRDEISRVADYSRRVIGDIRRISHDLHPAAIDHLGWQLAIEELFETLENTQDIEVDLKFEISEEALNDTQKVHLFRIVQEIVTNIAKHSRAKNCNARFTLKNDAVNVEITDDGPSHNGAIQDNPTRNQLGLVVIGQRVETLHGQWAIDRGAGETVFSLRFPNCQSGVRGEA